MAQEDVIFAGSGGENASIIMWSSVDHRMPMVISSFPKGYSVYALTVSPNGTRIAAGTKAGMVRVHALTSFQAVENSPSLFEVFHQPSVPVVSLTFCTDDILASGGLDGNIKLWSVPEQRELSEISVHTKGVFALQQIGSLVLAGIGGDGILRIWDMDSLEVKYEGEPFDLPRTRALTCLDYNAATGLLIHPSQTGELYAYDVRNEFAVRRIQAHHGDFSAVAYGSEYIVTAGSTDAMIKLWSSSLGKLITEASASAGTLAVAWFGTETIMAVSTDGSVHMWKIDDGLSAVSRFTDLDLRSITGLPPAVVTKCRIEADKQWRDGKLGKAKQLMSEPERHRELAIIIEELCQRDFSAEAALILADAARARGKLLWELNSRLAIVDGLGNNKAALPSLYALALLLYDIKETKLALHYFDKILQIDQNYRDVKQRICQLKVDPLLQLSPETDIRGDLMQKDLVFEELEKYTILEKKFLWRVLLNAGKPVSLKTVFSPQEVAESVMATMTKNGLGVARVELIQVKLFCNEELRNVTCVYMPLDTEKIGAVFALEIRPITSGTEFLPYAIFDVALLEIPRAKSVQEHNQKVKDAWTKFCGSAETKRLLADANKLAMQSIKRLGGKIMAKIDDEF